jgi:hypothetical protein
MNLPETEQVFRNLMSVLYKIRRGFGGTPGQTRTWALIGLLLTVLSSDPAPGEACAQLMLPRRLERRAQANSGAVEVAPGIWVYQITKNGLALQLTLQGTKYSKDDDLNK